MTPIELHMSNSSRYVIVSPCQQLASYQSSVESFKVRLDEVSRENTALTEEKRSFKFEINSLKRSLHEKQSQVAGLQAKIARWVVLNDIPTPQLVLLTCPLPL